MLPYSSQFPRLFFQSRHDPPRPPLCLTAHYPYRRRMGTSARSGGISTYSSLYVSSASPSYESSELTESKEDDMESMDDPLPGPYT